MKSLSDVQIAALLEVVRRDGGTYFGHRFSTLENLRRRGYLDRHTSHILKAEYVTADSVTLQYRHSARDPYLLHDWYVTQTGREVAAALRSRIPLKEE